MQFRKLSVPSGTQVSARHVNIESDEPLAASFVVVVIGNADRQRSFLAVIDVRVALSIVGWF